MMARQGQPTQGVIICWGIRNIVVRIPAEFGIDILLNGRRPFAQLVRKPLQ